MGEADAAIHTQVRSRHLLRDTLGCHVPQLLHILQLKNAITQQHRTLLETAIAGKRRRNEAILQQQRIELAARQRRKQLAATTERVGTSDHSTDSQPTAAATTETATQPAVAPLLSSSLPVAAAPLPSPDDFAAVIFPCPPAPQYSESQLLSLLPPVVAVHLLHCGFSSFSRSALAVLSEAAMDFIRRAGVALRESQDGSRARQRRRRRQSSKTNESGASGPEVGDWLAPRLLRSLGVSEARTLQRFYERAIVRAGERIRRTEERLTSIDAELRSQQPDTLPRLSGGKTGKGSVSSGNGGRWLCEPFSPLRTFVRPPDMPVTPPPLEEEKVEPEQTLAVADTASSGSSGNELPAVEAATGDVAANVPVNDSSTTGLNAQSAVGLSSSVAASESAHISFNSDEQAAAALPPLESVDGLYNSQPAQPMVE